MIPIKPTHFNRLDLRMVAVLLVVFLLIVPLGSAVGEESVAIATGWVTNSDTGLPIDGAYLSATYLYPEVEGEELAGETWTATDGRYTILDSGVYGASSTGSMSRLLVMSLNMSNMPGMA